LGNDASFHWRIVGTAPTIPAESPWCAIKNRRNTLMDVAGAAQNAGFSLAACSRTKSEIA
jgi:hypothetical protein